MFVLLFSSVTVTEDVRNQNILDFLSSTQSWVYTYIPTNIWLILPLSQLHLNQTIGSHQKASGINLAEFIYIGWFPSMGLAFRHRLQSFNRVELSKSIPDRFYTTTDSTTLSKRRSKLLPSDERKSIRMLRRNPGTTEAQAARDKSTVL